jgi:hypothetical protein
MLPMRGYTTKEKVKITAGGDGRADHCGLACRACPRILSAREEAAN